MKPKVLFYVQHLWGVGHVYRATRIAHGMRRAGMEVHLVWGGTRLPGFDFSGLEVHYLPAVRTSDVSFSTLLHADGKIFTDTDKDDRCKKLLALFDSIKPDILMTEAFPFGRRQMRFELLPLLDRAKEANPRPLIVASIRDIMQEGRKPARVEESVNLVRDYFDLVLVHGDPNLVAIGETLQGSEGFISKIRYTGLVVPEANTGGKPAPALAGKPDVIVSVGGGAFGQRLLFAALEAMPLCKTFPRNWLVTTGTEMDNADYLQICANAPEGMTIVRHIPDMVSALSTCQVSVSHSGYNTVGDILQAGCRSVLFPYVDGNETEQLRRAQMMARLGIARCIEPDEFSPASLARHIDAAAGMEPKSHGIDVQGASRTPQILLDELDSRC